MPRALVLICLLLLAVLEVHATSESTPAPVELEQILDGNSDINQFLSPATASCSVTDQPAFTITEALLPNCPGFRRDPGLGFAPENWGLVLSGADLMSATPEVSRATARHRAQTEVSVIDTGLRVVDNPAAGAFLNRQDLGSDELGHGTHVAGIVSSRDHGVNPGLKTRVIAVTRDSPAKLAQGMDQAISDPEVKVINFSWAVEDSQDITSAIRRASEAGKWVVIAAGNRGNLNDPEEKGLAEVEELPGVFIVGSSSPVAGMPSHFSSYGPHVDFYAPGSQIDSLNAFANPGFAPARNSMHQSGTSMAAPHAAGVLATLLVIQPDLKPREAELLIASTAILRGPPPGIPNLNPLLATETLLEMRKGCPKLNHQDPPARPYLDCLESALRAVKNAEELKASRRSPPQRPADCRSLTQHYARLRRSYFISQGGATESRDLLEFLTPLREPSPPSVAEAIWFTPATPTRTDPESLRIWTSTLQGILEESRAIEPLADDITHARRLLAADQATSLSPTPTERLEQLHARKENLQEYLSICVSDPPQATEARTALANACTGYLYAAPREFTRGLLDVISSDIKSARQPAGNETILLEQIQKSYDWINWLDNYSDKDPDSSRFILSYILERSALGSSSDPVTRELLATLARERTEPAPAGSPELNRALKTLLNHSPPLPDSIRTKVVQELDAILDLCLGVGNDCLASVYASGDTRNASTIQLPSDNINLHSRVLTEALKGDPALALDLARSLDSPPEKLQAFLTLFGSTSPMSEALIKGIPATESEALQSLTRNWLAWTSKMILSGKSCPPDTGSCANVQTLASQMAAIAATSQAHATSLRSGLENLESQMRGNEESQRLFLDALKLQLAASPDLTTSQERKSTIEALMKRYRADPTLTAAQLKVEASALLQDRELRLFYIRLLKRDLEQAVQNPSGMEVQAALSEVQYSEHDASLLIPTLETLFARASAGIPSPRHEQSGILMAFAHDFSDKPEHLQKWFTALKGFGAAVNSSEEKKLLVNAVIALAQTNVGAKLIREDSQLLDRFVEAFKNPDLQLRNQDLFPFNHFPEELAQRLMQELPPADEWAGFDPQIPEQKWISRFLEAGMSYEPVLDRVIEAFEMAPSQEAKNLLQSALLQGLMQHPIRARELSRPGALLDRSPELRSWIWGRSEP